MVSNKWNSLTELFFSQVEKHKKKPLTFAKTKGTWQSMTWTEVAEKVARLSDGLVRLGIKPGDRVVLVSENRPEWLIADLAIMAAGGISVPTYTTYTTPDYIHIMENSGAKASIVSTKLLAAKVLSAAHSVDSMQDIITIDDPKLEQSLSVNVHLWDTILENETGEFDGAISRSKDQTRDDIACLIYTSGTGGAPKGVMIHHGAILHNCHACSQVLSPLGIDGNSFLSFLPLSHAYEHTGGQFFPLSSGAEIWYAEGLEKLAANMAEARPSIMVVVPRLFEMLRTKLVRAMEKESAFKQKLFNRAIELGTRQFKDDSAPLTLFEKIEDWFLSITIRKKVQKRFGGRLKALVSGGAPLSPEVGYFFAALGLPLLQGYGQTESAPVASVNPPAKPKMHTVGLPLANTDIKIADDGEILIRGELVMKGYWRDEVSTNKTVINGWLHTGDIGTFDDDGYLIITDRKKDIIVNDKGDNVSPQKIEGLFALENEIAQAMIYGDRKPYLVGLIVPDAEWMTKWKQENPVQNKTSPQIEFQIDPETESGPANRQENTEQPPKRNLEYLRSDEAFKKALDTAITRVNKRLTNVEKVRKFIIAAEPFSIENEQMTPTLKVRRHIISAAYKDELEGLYGKG